MPLADFLLSLAFIPGTSVFENVSRHKRNIQVCKVWDSPLWSTDNGKVRKHDKDNSQQWDRVSLRNGRCLALRHIIA
jgi:hypothetical protein